MNRKVCQNGILLTYPKGKKQKNESQSMSKWHTFGILLTYPKGKRQENESKSMSKWHTFGILLTYPEEKNRKMNRRVCQNDILCPERKD